MSKKISVKEIAEALDALPGEAKAFLNRETGKVLAFGPEELALAADEDGEIESFADWQQEVADEAREVLNSEDWIELPGQFEIHEWEIMANFASSLPGEDQRAQVGDAIRGRGAFRQFKATISRLGIEDLWFAFKKQALEEFVRAWLAENGLDGE